MFVSGCGDFDLGFGNVSFGAAGEWRIDSFHLGFGFVGRAGRGFGGSRSFGTAGGGLVSSTIIAGLLTSLRTINRLFIGFFGRIL